MLRTDESPSNYASDANVERQETFDMDHHDAGHVSDTGPLLHAESLEERELELEERMMQEAKLESLRMMNHMLRTKITADVVFKTKLQTSWVTSLTTEVKAEQQRCRLREPGADRRLYGPYLVLLPPDVVAAITVETVLQRMLTGALCCSLVDVVSGVGQKVQEALEITLVQRTEVHDGRKAKGLPPAPFVPLQSELLLKLMEERREEARKYRLFGRQLRGDSQSPLTGAALHEAFVQDGEATGVSRSTASLSGTGGLESVASWSPAIRVKVGAILVHLLMRTAMVHFDPHSGRLVEEEGIPDLPEPTNHLHPVRGAAGATLGDSELREVDPHNVGASPAWLARASVTIPLRTPLTPAAAMSSPEPPMPSVARVMQGKPLAGTWGANEPLLDAHGAGVAAAVDPAASALRVPGQVVQPRSGVHTSDSGLSPDSSSGGMDPALTAPWRTLGFGSTVKVRKEGGTLVAEGAKAASTVASLHPHLQIDAATMSTMGVKLRPFKEHVGQEGGGGAAGGGAGVEEGEPKVDTLGRGNTEALVRKLGRIVARQAMEAVRTVTLADGRVVTAVPAFLHDYVWSAGRLTAHGRASTKHLLTGRAKVDEGDFESQYTPGVRFISFLFAHPRLVDILSARQAVMAHQAYRPMVVEPLPWRAFRGPGPYLHARPPFMRTNSKAHTRIVSEALARPGMMEGLLQGLNVLSQTPWKINNKVLDVLKRVWGEDGQALPSGLPRVPDMPAYEADDPAVPPTWAEYMATLPAGERPERKTPQFNEAFKSYLKQTKADYKVRQENHSLRSDFRLKLRVALDHASDPALYFPHNLDFRGRAYPIPPHLNHMGSDVCRALLQYAVDQPLGERGLEWLFIHCANMMGKDKLGLEDRAAYAQAHITQILAAADRPLSPGGGWWLQADKPWEALAVMQELAVALRTPGHARHAVLCSLPVHQDGSCNGLQHYAALGRDATGGKAVNLVAGEENKPSDVYSQVLALVLKRLEKDLALAVPEAEVARCLHNPVELKERTKFFATMASEGSWDNSRAANELPLLAARKAVALLLSGHVDRKVVKQTVMTSVYGVTFIGARQQIYNRLRERMHSNTLPDGQRYDREALDHLQWGCSQYLARSVFNSLGDLFTSANAIKQWLAESAKAMSSMGQPVCWVTPLGLPCMQPYRREDPAVIIAGRLGQVHVATSDDPAHIISVNKQTSAFPPNFIHSLDSTHMLLTAVACSKEGITFSAVHDSYWCHPSQVDRMRDVLRDQFVELYR